jgi:hypothetical protein
MGLIATNKPTTISEDNHGCIALVKGKKTPARTKHVAVRIGFLRDLFEAKVINIKPCPTAEMIADPLTKPLGPIEFKTKIATMVATSEETDIDSGPITDSDDDDGDDDEAIDQITENESGTSTRSRESVITQAAAPRSPSDLKDGLRRHGRNLLQKP